MCVRILVDAWASGELYAYVEALRLDCTDTLSDRDGRDSVCRFIVAGGWESRLYSERPMPFLGISCDR